MRSVQRGISAAFLVIAILAITVASTAGYFVFSRNLTEKIKAINSFEQCARHYPVMESYPEQCKTPDGKHFTRQLTEDEKQKLVPSEEPSSSPLVKGCKVGGCSGQICSDEEGIITTCEFKAEYACYKTAKCERQSNGQCGWTQTEELNSCLNNTQE